MNELRQILKKLQCQFCDITHCTIQEEWACTCIRDTERQIRVWAKGKVAPKSVDCYEQTLKNLEKD